MAAEKPRAGYFGRGKTLGGLFWLRKNLGFRYFGCGKTMRTRTFWKFEIQTPHFCCIEDPQRSSFVRPEYPSGLVLGPGIGRSPVRFPAPRRSFRGHFFVNVGMSWDVSGSGLGTFSDGFGMVLEKMSDGAEKSTFSKMTGSIFPESGCLKITCLGDPRPKISKF